MFVIALMIAFPSRSTVIIEEGFNYSAGSGLGGDSPWGGGAAFTNLAIGSGNLTYTNLLATVPTGNMLLLAGFKTSRAYRPVPGVSQAGTDLYVSFILKCVTLPTNTQFMMAILPLGVTTNNPPNDPLDFYVAPNGTGFTFDVAHVGATVPFAASVSLTLNTTHLLVLKYVGAGGGRAALYIDPIPGNAEPSPNVITQLGSLTNALLGELYMLGSSNVTQGAYQIDTLRVGTNWADAVPAQVVTLSVSGPGNVTTCTGSSATFGVTVIGNNPITYQWRTNGVAVSAATNKTFFLPSPGLVDTQASYDVVVHDAFGSITSSIGHLSFVSTPATIFSSPQNQILWPGTTNATFSVLAQGDAPLSYQWRTNGIAIAGATNASLTLTNPSGTYASNLIDVVVANPCATITSSTASVQFPHQFILGTGLPGLFGGMNLFVTNPAGRSLFLWSSPSNNIPIPAWTLEGHMGEQPLNDGTGNSRYTLNVNPVSTPYFYVAGSNNSNPLLPPVPIIEVDSDFSSDPPDYTLINSNYWADTLGTPGNPFAPVVLQNPSNTTVLAGSGATFNSSANGSVPLKYQWLFNGSPLSGAQQTNLPLLNINASNAGLYSVVASNAFGRITSSIAALTVIQPVTASAIGGISGASGFLLSGTNSPGSAFEVLATTNLNPPANWTLLGSALVASNGSYSFTDTNSAGFPSRFYSLVFSSLNHFLPIVTQQPSGRSLLAGKVANLNGGDSGQPAVGIQWFASGNAITNATNASLTVTGASPPQTLAYYFVLSNAYGKTTSSIATVKVLPPPTIKGVISKTGLQLTASAVAGDPYIIETATNLTPPFTWSPLLTNTVANDGSILFKETNTGVDQKFYRILFP